MKNKKALAMVIAGTLMLCGCGNTATNKEGTTEAASESTEDKTETSEASEGKVINPLPSAVDINNMTEGIYAVEFNTNNVTKDDAGKIQLSLKVYEIELFDAIDVSMLKVGDTVVIGKQNVKVDELTTDDDGTILINGGFAGNASGGHELTPSNEGGTYSEIQYELPIYTYVGEVTLPVSAETVVHDNSDISQGEKIVKIDDMVSNPESVYADYSPYDTTVRLENGEVVSIDRIYTP